MFRSGVIALLGLLLSVSWAFADPVGVYDVEGSDPAGGGATYRGTVEVARTGETYRVIWTIGDATYTGTAIGNDNALSVVYASEGSVQAGLAVYSREPGGDWVGLWTPSDGTALGKERWHRR